MLQTDNLTVTAGSWTTHVGYELLDAPTMIFIVCLMLFSYGPIFSTQGLKQII